MMPINDESIPLAPWHGQTPTLLEYGHSPWRESSQIAATFYDRGYKLWTKDDLRDIERQIEQSVNQMVFSVRSINGTLIQIRNLNFEKDNPIWKPFVKYQEYWRLVKTQPDGPPETYLCSYLPEWSNSTVRAFRGIVKDPISIFERNRHIWNGSESCKLLKSCLQQHLTTRQVTKVACFGLGDVCRKPPEWLRRQITSDEDELDASIVSPNMLQHLIAVTIVEVCREHTRSSVELLAQDPDYTRETEDILKQNGFSIVGRHGAGGFAEIDDTTIVFSVFVEAPLKQIIADIARPTMIISTGFEVFNDHELSFPSLCSYDPLLI
ncbi:hypothetical protein FOC4_g10000151 [Fusarium odoratissimum]|uniref:SRR1-like domain-containing protein n=4 Tax=Fusarium oxysporum species complex TaxID=171631 RepID=N1S053_FUSC4|nr:hypothetical protein FOC4_g10000151 [Fusarium odoratissimum]ENH70676.1 hypothetical protein FOC1_g10000394 [Fusarium oxysporum f. sp. cubense race 1]TXB97966.1 hypothetical protein FocTR4_00016878 [Fusarium oxysporum f. sp. cubense]